MVHSKTHDQMYPSLLLALLALTCVDATKIIPYKTQYRFLKQITSFDNDDILMNFDCDGTHIIIRKCHRYEDIFKRNSSVLLYNKTFTFHDGLSPQQIINNTKIITLAKRKTISSTSLRIEHCHTDNSGFYMSKCYKKNGRVKIKIVPVFCSEIIPALQMPYRNKIVWYLKISPDTILEMVKCKETFPPYRIVHETSRVRIYEIDVEPSVVVTHPYHSKDDSLYKMLNYHPDVTVFCHVLLGTIFRTAFYSEDFKVMHT